MERSSDLGLRLMEPGQAETAMRVVTIDGPAGAGKSTVARRLAERLGWRLLDTGAMYRAIAFAGLKSLISPEDEAAWSCLAETITIELPPGRVLLNGEDVTGEIRTIQVTRATRFAADSPSVRARLVDCQRSFAHREENIVAEGRDQGTVVFPEAFLKFFLTASDEERARRRLAEFEAKGQSIPFDELLAELKARDRQDEERAIAPMRPAPDAKIIDCTHMSMDDVVTHLENLVRSLIDRPSEKLDA